MKGLWRDFTGIVFYFGPALIGVILAPFWWVYVTVRCAISGHQWRYSSPEFSSEQVCLRCVKWRNDAN